MHQRTHRTLLIQLVEQYITENTHTFPQDCTEEELGKVFSLSKAHDVAHLIGVAAEQADVPNKEVFRPFFREEMLAMYRYQRQQAEYVKICQQLEECKIPYIPLKGAVIQRLYRESWHRTSCDIDILIPEDRLDEAVNAMQKRLHYENKGMTRHDVSLWSPSGVHFELHYDLDETFVTAQEYWDDAVQVGQSYCRELSAEFLMTTYVAHMAKHFVNGGCGLRPFVDLQLMLQKIPFNGKKFNKMLDNHSLLSFSQSVFHLLDIWFGGKEMDEEAQTVMSFIFPGGAYGSLENRIALARTSISDSGYLCRRLFPPVSVLRTLYPVLDKCPWLLPVCWIRRGARLVFTGKLSQLNREQSINRRFSQTDNGRTERMLKQLNIK